MAVLQITVCDVCQDRSRPTRTFEVRDVKADEAVVVELCDEHSIALQGFLQTGLALPTTRPRRKANRFESRVATPEEIEAMKAAGRA